eukprot:g12481.t1
MKVALRSGWLEPAMLPSTVLCQKDLDDLAKRLGWRKLPGLVPIPGSPHRAHFKSSDSDRLRSITIHVGRYLPGLWSKAGDLLDAGSTIFVGPAGCGKTTILRDVAVNMSKELQVLVLDFLGHLADMESSPDLDYQCWGSGSEAQTIREAIDEHVPEVIVAEFPDTYSALRAGRELFRCDVLRGGFWGVGEQPRDAVLDPRHGASRHDPTSDAQSAALHGASGLCVARSAQGQPQLRQSDLGREASTAEPGEG